MTSVFDLTPAELTAWLAQRGQPAYRARQIYEALYHRRISDFNELKQLPDALRKELAASFSLSTLTPVEEHRSTDGTVKYLSRFEDGATLETVLIPMGSRKTVCVSTQVGCAYACAFCASGLQGFQRNLSAAEIVQQILRVERDINSSGEGALLGGSGKLPHNRPHRFMQGGGERRGKPRSGFPLRMGNTKGVTHIVFMGMGEPMANYNNLLKAIRIMNAPEGLAIGARKITISTVGLVPKIEALSKEGLQLELAISLHAPNDDLRGQIMPVNRRYPLAELIRACRRFARKTKRLLTFEYILIDQVNDEVKHAEELAKLLKGLPAKVNLIPCHPIPGMPFQRPAKSRMLAFEKALKNGGIYCTLRKSRGLDIEGACGQLRLRYNESHAPGHSPNP